LDGLDGPAPDRGCRRGPARRRAGDEAGAGRRGRVHRGEPAVPRVGAGGAVDAQRQARPQLHRGSGRRGGAAARGSGSRDVAALYPGSVVASYGDPVGRAAPIAHTDSPDPPVWSADGSHLAYVRVDGNVEIVETRTGRSRLLRTRQLARGWASSLAVSLAADGRRTAIVRSYPAEAWIA